MDDVNENDSDNVIGWKQYSLLRFGHRGKRMTGMDMDKLHHMKMFGMKNVILEKC